jgi:membrane dipeptidase
MGRNKTWSGYRAYQYLEPRIDYKEFKLRKGVRENWAYKIPLSNNEEDRFEELIENSIIISLHEHPCLYPDDISQSPDLFPEGRQFLAYEALSTSGLDAVFDNLMDGRSYAYTKHGWDWIGTVHDIGMRACDVSHSDFVIHCRTVEDIIEAQKNGKLAWVACLESASCIENEVDRLDILYGLGVRSVGICYNESNMLGGGMGEIKESGLTNFGYDAVKRMNKLGMLIDLGHVCNLTALETIEASSHPVYNSHSGPAAIAQGHTTSDEVLLSLAENEGLIGLGGAGRGFSTKNNPIGSIESYIECLVYCIDLMGIDHVAGGPDTLYGDHQDHYSAFAMRYATDGYGQSSRPGRMSRKRREPPEGVVNQGYVKGLENPSEFVNIARWMILNGYSDLEIKKIIGENAIKFLKKAW